MDAGRRLHVGAIAKEDGAQVDAGGAPSGTHAAAATAHNRAIQLDRLNGGSHRQRRLGVSRAQLQGR